MMKIFRHEFPPRMPCYINTSPYSMDRYRKGYISISTERDTPERIISSIIHEASHFMFWKYEAAFCRRLGLRPREIDEVKEVLTVINNVVFSGVQDVGWRVHAQQRAAALKKWQQTEDIRAVIEDLAVKLHRGNDRAAQRV